MKANFQLTQEKLIHIILFLLIAILPAVTYMILFPNLLSSYEWCANSAIESDLFLIAKGRVFLAICLFTAGLGMWVHKSSYSKGKGAKTNQKQPVEVYLLLGYAILCLLSFLFSEHLSVGLQGAMEQHETIFVLLGYCLICFFFIYFSKNYNLIRIMGISALIGCGIQIVVCLLQYFGYDLLSFSFVQKLLIPNFIRQGSEKIELLLGINDYNRVYGTLYNPNYVGLYTNLMLPLIVASILNSKKVVIRIISSIVAVLLLFVTFASGSKAFILTSIAQLIFTAFLLRKTIVKHWKSFTVCVFFLLICFFGYNAVNQNILTKALTRALTITKQDYALENIVVSNDSVQIDYDSKTVHLNFSFEDNRMEFWSCDEYGTNYTTFYDESGCFRFEDSTFSSWGISAGKIQDKYICIVTIDGIPWYFSKSENGYQYITPGGKVSEIVVADSVMNGYEKILSNRGYIWSRSIPLLKDNIILGSGPDTYILQFKQNDYVAAVNSGYYNMIISRPHNIYLQMGIQTGAISLIIYISLFVVYAFKTLKSFSGKTEWTNDKRWQLAIFVSMTGYMIATFSSDSLIVTAPIFWTLIGVGIGFNLKKNTDC